MAELMQDFNVDVALAVAIRKLAARRMDERIARDARDHDAATGLRQSIYDDAAMVYDQYDPRRG